jgi:predicted nucleic acid-binding protein
MKNIKVLDSSFISSVLLEDDSNHEIALKELYNVIINSNTLIPSTVLLELELLPKSIGNKDYYKKIDILLSKIEFELVNIEPSFLKEYRLLNRKLDQILTAIDLTVLTTAISNNAELITFDKKLLKVYNQLINN